MVNGTIKIAIAGKITEIRGNNSEVQVIIKSRKKPQIRLIQGSALLKNESGATQILSQNLVTPLTTVAERAPAEAEPATPPSIIESSLETVVHTDVLYDFYVNRNGQLKLRSQRRSFVPHVVRLNWKTQGPVEHVYGQLADNADFSTSGAFFTASSANSSAEFKHAYLGLNFYSLSADGKIWSEARPFSVVAESLNVAPPKIHLSTKKLYLDTGPGKISVKPEGESDELSYYIVDIAPDEKFRPEETRSFLTGHHGLILPFKAAQTLYMRARGVNADLQITSFSLVSKVEILEKSPPPPALPLKLVKAVPSIPKILSLRKPTATETATSSLKLEPDITGFLNPNYLSSKLSFEGAAFTMYSQDQVEQGKANPTALMLGIRTMNWFDNQGVEASFKTKVSTISSSQASDVAPMQLEARYHHRWSLPFSPFSRLGSSQMSLFAGYEYYRNPQGGSLFSPRYDLLKAGLALSFPVDRRWDTGGELAYGYGLDQSQKYEISGYLSYYLQKNWSIGAGYRMHLFIAGSDESSPLGLPYREGFGEGYTVLRWHY